MARSVFKMQKRPAGMAYKTYRAMSAAKNLDPMESDAWKALPIEGEGDDSDDSEESAQAGPPDADGDNDGSPAGEEEGDDDDADDDDAEKSVEVGNLLKALAAADDVADVVDDHVSREDYLMARLNKGTISKSEQGELGRLWNDGGPVARPDASLRKSLTEILDEDDARVVDASPILTALFDGMSDQLGDIREDISKSDRIGRETMQLQLTLTKAMIPVVVSLEAQLAKSMDVIDALGERMKIVERAPRGRRSVSAAQRGGAGQPRPLAKSVTSGGSGAEADNGQRSPLSKGQVVQALNALTAGARKNGDVNLAKSLVHETAKFESTGQLSRGTLAAVHGMQS